MMSRGRIVVKAVTTKITYYNHSIFSDRVVFDSHALPPL
jgi:hypothetical protein